MAMTQASGAASPAPAVGSSPPDLADLSGCSGVRRRAPCSSPSSSGSSSPILSALAGGGVFYSVDGTLNYLDVAAQVGIVGTAVALLMIGGEFDLSIGSLIGFAGIVIGICVTTYGLPVWAGILISLVLTTLLGVMNGFIVVRTGLPSFIVTLATLFIIRGATQALTAQITQITYIPIAPDGDRGRPDRRALQLEHRQLQGLDPVVDPARGHRRRTSSAGPGSATGSPASAARRARPATWASRSTASRSCCSPGRRSRRPSWPPSRA